MRYRRARLFSYSDLPHRLDNFDFAFQEIVDQIGQVDALGVGLRRQIILHAFIEIDRQFGI